MGRNQRDDVKKSIADCLNTLGNYCYDLKQGYIHQNIENFESGAMKNYAQLMSEREYNILMKAYQQLEIAQIFIKSQNSCIEVFLHEEENTME